MTRARVLAAVRRFWLAPAAPDSAAFLRLALAILGLIQLTALWSHLLDLYGNYGYVQWAVAEASNSAWVPSIGKLALVLDDFGVGSATTVYLVFGLYGASLIGLLIGYRTRLFAVLAWIGHAITLNSGFFSVYGVDTMMHILFCYLAFSPAGAKWSVDAYLGRTSPEPSATARIAQRVVQLHLCIIYLNTGIAKAAGESWWNGEAIWRATMQPHFRGLDLSFLAAHPMIPMVMCWSVLALELGYAALIWIPRTRRLALFGMLAMHLGIAISMQLWLFSLTMIAFNLSAFGWSLARAPATMAAADSVPMQLAPIVEPS